MSVDQVQDRPSLPMHRGPLLAERVADEVRQGIVDGTFKPGHKLPTEREMSETYGVSRAIVREALGRLKHDGMVVSRQGSGAFVHDGAAPTLRLSITPTHADDIRALVELLSAVRAAASSHAALRRTPAQLADITRRCEAVGQAVRAGLDGEEEDIAFHRAIIEAAGNPYFNEILAFLDGRLRSFVRTARTNSRQHGLAEQVQREHEAMRDAIAARAPDLARQAAEQHLANALKRLGLLPARPARQAAAGTRAP